MSNCRIRLYQDSDYDRVREVYSKSVKDLTPDGFYLALRSFHIRLFIFIVFLLLLVTVRSFLASIFGVVLMLIFVWWCSRDFFHSYVRVTFSSDMLDIQKTYMQGDSHRFWVAEYGGTVVGMVAVIPSPLVNGEMGMELKRMAVIEGQRGKGIATALCKTVLDFARTRGSKVVVLETSTVQTTAQRMYVRMGFRKIKTYDYGKIKARLIGIRALAGATDHGSMGFIYKMRNTALKRKCI
uniref:N-acetyltransferase domain-containing protein n=1 Tax=Leptobrachium leishanense TaxID=445787 RepID=A0A8C5PRR6_9ANUR